MFTRFWLGLNGWAEALGMDDPRGEYMSGLEDRVARLEREVVGLQVKSRTTPVASADEYRDITAEGLLRASSFKGLSQK
jgi:hypothetical protein